MIIDYKALLNKDDIIALYDLDRYKPQTQKNYCYSIMKKVKEAYKEETGTDWEDSFTQKNIHQKRKKIDFMQIINLKIKSMLFQI